MTAVARVFSPTSSEAARYQAILQARIDEGRKSALRTIEYVQANQPKDQIVSTRNVEFIAAGVQRQLRVFIGDEQLEPSEYAVGQLAERARVPKAYLRELSAPNAKGEDGMWRRELAAEVLNRHYQHVPKERVLARSVRGVLKGWLSDRFRRLDCRPLIDALASEAEKIGAVPIDGVASETRVALKVVMPEILEPVPGEFMVLGGEWSNSDYGNGAHSFREFGMRVVCLNGMTRENVMKEIHLGARLDDNIAYSDRTYRLDTATSVSALRDTIRSVLGPDSRDKFLNSIRAAQARGMTTAQLKRAVHDLGKQVQKDIVSAYESQDIINLPAGETAWRASNAISWIAKHTENPELRLDLERRAGTVAGKEAA
jgi:hypothetical protein